MNETSTKVIVPNGMIPRDDLRSQLIEVGLRLIAQKCGDPKDWPEKYGADFNNDVFCMHPECWCEKEDCKYCREDNAAPNFIYYDNGLQIRWYKYIGRSMETQGDFSTEEILEVIRRCLESIRPK